MTDAMVTRRLAAIVAADVAGFSRLMSLDESGTLLALTALRREVVDPLLTSEGGRVVKTMGDGLLIEFASVVGATSFSVAMQRAMRRRNAEVPADRRIEFRIGVNLGDVLVQDDDIFGEGVNVAARLESIADPGGVCISDGALRQVGARLALETEDMGERSLKNIETPVRVHRVRGLVPPGRAATSAAAKAEAAPLPLPPARPSLAVLPFRPMGAGEEAGFVADGVALGIQTLLVQLPSLFLVNACLHPGYREGRQTAREALAEMPVRFALEGEVQHAAGRVRIRVRATELATGAVAWAESYDRDLDDVFALQDEIAREVAAALGAELIGGHLARDFTGGLAASGCWEDFLHGIDHLYRWTRRDCAEAIRRFERVTEAVPESAVGPGYLALLNFYAAGRGWAPDAAALAEAERWARVAVAIEDGNNGLGHAVLGALALRERRHAESLALCRTAVRYRASCPFALGQLGVTETYSGDPASGAKHVREAMSVRVTQPPPMVDALAIACRDRGEIDLSIRAAEEATRLDPGYVGALVTLCSDLVLKGDVTAAHDVARGIVELEPDFAVEAYLRRQPYASADALERLGTSLREGGLAG